MTWAAVARPSDDEHGIHVHFLIARYDTGSGKAEPRATWVEGLRAVADLWNAERSGGPRSPDHARTVQLPGPRIAERPPPGGTPVAAGYPESITVDLTDLIVTGQIRDRDQSGGSICGTWAGRSTASPPTTSAFSAGGEQKASDLPGGIYDSDFWTTAAGELGGRSGRGSRTRPTSTMDENGSSSNRTKRQNFGASTRTS